MAGEIELRQAGRLIAHRMAQTVDTVAGELARKASGGASGLRSAAGIRHIDGDAGRVVEGVIIEPTGMHGTDLYGQRIAIDPDKVVVRPLHNDHGGVVGLRIPANHDDLRSAARWADGQLLGHFTTRVHMVPRADGRRASSLSEDWDSHPFFVVGKFDARDAEVVLEHSGRTGMEPVRVGAAEVGRLIARSREFDELTASRTGSQRPVVLVSQGTGVTDPKLAASIAEYLHGETDLIGPVRGVVYPTTRVEPARSGFLVYPELEARVTLDSTLQPTSEYLEYRHPRFTGGA